MPAHMRTSGPDCPCEDDCKIVSDGFDTDTNANYTKSGTMTHSGSEMTSTSNPFRAIHNTTGTTGHFYTRIRGQVSATGTLRAYGWIDANTHLRADLDIATGASVVKIYTVSGGTPTLVSTSEAFLGELDFDYDLTLCFDGSVATAAVFRVSDGQILRSVNASYGTAINQTGFGSVPGGTATFKEFEYKGHIDDDPTNTDCETCETITTCVCTGHGEVDNCEDGLQPDELIADIYFDSGDADCGLCDDIPGTYVLPRMNCGEYNAASGTFSKFCLSLTGLDEQCKKRFGTDKTTPLFNQSISGANCPGHQLPSGHALRMYAQVYLVKVSGAYYLYGFMEVYRVWPSVVDYEASRIVLRSASLGSTPPDCLTGFAAGILLDDEVCREEDSNFICDVLNPTITVYNV